MDNRFDCIILGGGPAGYTAALYCSRAGINTLVVEKFSAGGQMTQTAQIDNYPGFDEGVDGFTLGFKMQSGAERFGARTIRAEVLRADLSGKLKKIETSEGVFLAPAVIIATGARHKHLGIENEEALVGKGVGYCAACDGMFYKDKAVAVIGGGNSAAADALHLSKICSRVILIHRRDTLRAEKFYHEPLMNCENVEFAWNSVPDKLLFEDRITGIRVKNVNTAQEKEYTVSGVFISIGRTPETELFKDELELDRYGYIVADESTRTNLDGVFAAGDVRTKAVRQIVTAAADGATASHFVQEFLAKNK